MKVFLWVIGKKRMIGKEGKLWCQICLESGFRNNRGVFQRMHRMGAKSRFKWEENDGKADQAEDRT